MLAKVHKDIGPSARIVKAQKVRSGGFKGFFAREKFEIIVETDPAPPAGQIGSEATVEVPKPTIAPGTSLEDLANQINESERVIDSPMTRSQPSADVDSPQISTESESFAEILSRMAFQADMQDVAPASPAKVELNDDAADETEAELSGNDNDTGNIESSRFVDDDDEEDYEFADGEVLYVDDDAIDLLEEERTGPAIPDRPAFLDVRTKVPAIAERKIDGLSVPVSRTRKSDSPLALLGVPVEFIPDALDLSDPAILRETLTSALADIPRAPTIEPSRGSIVAVVGQRLEAMALAEELADSFGRPRDEVVLASMDYRGRDVTASRLLRTVRDAEDAQRSWQRRNRPTIVAIEATLGGRTVTWAEHVLTALEPIATYGVTEATRKSEDIAAWAGALGGIDCLAINHMHETISPAAVLSAGIPVDRLDGRQASPAYWAMLLSERLSAA